MVIDLSATQKRYAEQMSGFTEVYGGSEQATGPGYWLYNVTGVDSSGALMVPVYSESYSLEEESSSENVKLLLVIERVSDVVGNDSIWVDDRGGDRNSLMNPLLSAGRQFIIRQVGNRDLYFNGSKQPLKAISRSVKLTMSYQITKTKHNKKVRETYHCGAVTVKLTEQGEDLWLVVLKEQRKGYCWLLCHLNETCQDAVIRTAFVGYGHRWKIEAVHRQVKVDYDLEGICLQRHDALKAMNALLWTAVSFLYTRLDNLSIAIITHVELGLHNRNKWSDLLRFIYYKLAYAVKKLLALSKLYKPPTFVTPNSHQLCPSLQ
jgi:hypothetical protein